MPTVPSTAMRVPTPTPAMLRRPRKMTEIDAGAVDEDQLDGRRVVLGRDPHRADLAGDAAPVVASGRRRSGMAARAPARWSRRRRRRRSSGAGGVDCRPSPCRRRAGGRRWPTAAPAPGSRRRGGTAPAVTLAWGRRDTCSRMRVGGLVVQHAVPDAPVLAVGEQHRHLGLAVGQLADDALDRGAGEPPVGAVDELERHPLQAGAAPTRRPAPAACASSMTKCTARSSSGVSVRAYWMARAEAMSSRSTNTSTTWRRRIGAVAAAGTSCSSCTASRSYCRFSRSSIDHEERHDDEHHPGVVEPGDERR